MITRLPVPTAAAARLRRVAALIPTAVLAVAASACVYSIEDHDYLSAQQMRALDIQGFVDAGQVPITLQMYNWSAGTWDDIATTSSANFSITYGGQSMYPWGLDDFDFQAVPGWECYWDASGGCRFVSGHAKLRFTWPSSDYEHLFVYAQGGVQCVRDQVEGQGEALSVAVLDCGLSPNSPVLTLHAGVIN